jgi:hypothetical protein
MEMIALAFIAGIFLIAIVAILLVRGAKVSPCQGAEILTEGDRDFPEPFANRRSTEHCINCGLNIDPWCACERGRKLAEQRKKEADDRMRSLSTKTPVADWDVAQAAEPDPHPPL